MSLRRTTLRRRGLVIGLSAISLAVVIFLGSLFQAALTVGEAMAQSSVDDADADSGLDELLE